MRILIATGIFPPDIGGPATYSKIIAEEFSRRGHDITIVTYSDNTISNFQFPIFKQIKNISRKLPKGVRHLVYFWQVLKNGASVDIIYAQDAVSAGFPAVVAALLLRKKFFLKVVGDHAWEQGRQRFGITDTLDEFLGKRYGLHVRFFCMVQFFTASRATRVITPSTYLKSVVERWGISPQRISVIPNAVSLSEHLLSKEEARKEFRLEGFLLITIGRLVPWKGFQMLVDVMPKLIEKVPDVKLIIIGDGPERKEIELRITNYELWGKVIMTGSILKKKLEQYLVAADVFLLNTSYEGFSHQLIEAMAMGIPVITTNAGGNKEVVRDGENALLARYNDAADWEEKILRLYKDEELRYRLSRSNTDIAKTYSVENMVQKIENLLLTT